jgi:hypothetical protein
MFVLCVLCVVMYRSLRRADDSSRGVLPTVCASLCVIKKPRGRGHNLRLTAVPIIIIKIIIINAYLNTGVSRETLSKSGKLRS